MQVLQELNAEGVDLPRRLPQHNPGMAFCSAQPVQTSHRASGKCRCCRSWTQRGGTCRDVCWSTRRERVATLHGLFRT